MSAQQRAWPAWLAPVLGALALSGGAWLLLGPAAWSPSRAYAGQDYLDAYGTVWFYWWFDRALEGGTGWLHTDLLFFPWGKDIYLHTGGNLLDAALSWPLRALLGPVAGTNTWLALVLAGNGAATAWAARSFGLGRAAVGVACVFGLVSPYALLELGMGRWTQAMLVFPILWLGCLAGPPTLRRGLAGGVALGLSGLTYWYYGLLGALVGAVALAVALVRGPERLRELGRIGVAAVVAALVALPAAWPMLQALGGGEVPGLLALSDAPGELGRLQLRTEQGDVQGLFVLGLGGRAGGLLDETGLTWFPGVRMVHLAHGVALILALVAARQRELRPPVALAAAWLIAMALVAVGPAAAVGDGFLANPIYLFAVERLDLLRRWWWPGRALAFALPALALLGAAGVQGLPERLHWPASGVLAVGLVVGVAWGGQLPMKHWSAAVSPGLHCLAEAPDGAVIELPYAHDQKNLYHQTVHGKPQLGGMLVTKDAFVPAGTTALVEENSYASLVIALGQQQFTRQPEWRAEDREALLQLGFRYVLARKGAFRRARPRRDGTTEWSSDWGRAARVLEPVVGQPAWQDDQVAIYVLDNGEGAGASLECEAPAP